MRFIDSWLGFSLNSIAVSSGDQLPPEVTVYNIYVILPHTAAATKHHFHYQSNLSVCY